MMKEALYGNATTIDRETDPVLQASVGTRYVLLLDTAKIHSWDGVLLRSCRLLEQSLPVYSVQPIELAQPYTCRAHASSRWQRKALLAQDAP